MANAAECEPRPLGHNVRYMEEHPERIEYCDGLNTFLGNRASRVILRLKLNIKNRENVKTGQISSIRICKYMYPARGRTVSLGTLGVILKNLVNYH